jgi:putative holliday junction resolvase
LARILAIDYGLKRVGLAVTDPMQIIANSLTTVNAPEIFNFLAKYFLNEKVEKVIIGLPKQMNNQPSESMPLVEKFVEKFKKQFPEMPIEYLDERFTSKMAVQAMIQGGVKKKDRQNKALIDTLSATILLQSYLEGKR